MPRRALAEKRPLLLASMAAALAFYYLRWGPWPELYLIPLKGAAVGLLAVYLWLRHGSPDAIRSGGSSNLRLEPARDPLGERHVEEAVTVDHQLHIRPDGISHGDDARNSRGDPCAGSNSCSA